MEEIPKAPAIDERKLNQVWAQLKAMVPHYTPEWPASDPQDPGAALLKIFSFLVEGVLKRLNQVPRKNFVAFLDMLGIRLLPAQPSRVPIHFKIAPGTAREFLVPAQTQAKAPATDERPEDLPFETEESLWAIPSALKEVYSVDPEKDAIYKPPPKFLELESAAEPKPAYRTVSFSAAGSTTFQLDRIQELEEGDFLKIEIKQDPREEGECRHGAEVEDTTSAAEYLVVAKIEGQVVTLEDKLKRDYPAGTEVEKLTRYHIFEGWNMQEHAFYLGHSDVFNIKSASQISLVFAHMAGTASGISPLELAWEYWGAVKGEEGDSWQAFEVESDGTVGLSQSGTIVLSKPEGEIKEHEINGVSSRWIRCTLDQAIPSTEFLKLPELESITLLVKSKGDGLPPDQAFHNDTPLDVNLPFSPFGSQPRVLDRFSIGSKEIFSKKKAKVTLHVTLDEKGLFASPAAVLSGKKLHVFSRGAAGRLSEIQIDPFGEPAGSPEFYRHENLDQVRIALGSSPAATAVGSNLFVFFRAENGHIYKRFFNGTRPWSSEDLGLPNGVDTFVFDPFAVLASNLPRVYAVGSNRELYSRGIETTGAVTGVWESHGRPSGVIDSSPFVAVNAEGKPRVYVSDTGGIVHEWNGAEAKSPWKSLEHGDTFRVGVDPRGKGRDFPGAPGHSRPFAQLGSGSARVVVLDAEGNLNEYRSSLPGWENLGAPSKEVKAVSHPTGFYDNLGSPEERRRLFVRGSDGLLWERTSRDDPNDWIPHEKGGAPSALAYIYKEQQTDRSYLSILSSTSKDTVAEFRLVYKEAGTAAGGPNQVLVLDEGAPRNDNEYNGKKLYISEGFGADNLFRTIRTYGSDRVARLSEETPWETVPDADSTYRVVDPTPIHSGTASSTSDKDVRLNPRAEGFSRVREGQVIEIIDGTNRQIRLITSNPQPNGTVTVFPALGSLGRSPSYHVFELVRQGKVSSATGRAIILADGAFRSPDRYIDREIEVTTRVEPPENRTIESYDAVTHVAIVRRLNGSDKWTVDPEKSSIYRIGGELSGSPQYRDPLEEELIPELSWEYWNSHGWVAFRRDAHRFKDGTRNLLDSGEVEFVVPEEIEKTDVSGQENYWIRARLVGGDYGTEQFELEAKNGTTTLVSNKGSLRPPLISRLLIDYELIEPEFPEQCITFNNRDYVDQTAACKTSGNKFAPFVPLEDKTRALYLGFDTAFSGGPVRILFAARELPYSAEEKPKLEWTFRAENEWKRLAFEDETNGLIKREILTLQVPKGFQVVSRFGSDLYWLRGSFVNGKDSETPVLSGIFPNTTWAVQAETVLDEVLGSGDGEPKQKFQFLKFPVRKGEKVRIREVLSEEERADLVERFGEDAIHEEKDEKGVVLETWVGWTEVPTFIHSTAESREYKLDRATGEFELGDGKQGRVVPAGASNVRVFSYQTGGGAKGNVAVGEVSTLVTAIAGVESVVNPVEAGGGSDTATLDQMLVIGPAQISNGGRAVTPEDFEWLAKEASREVIKARCLPATNSQQRPEAGSVNVFIVPDSREDQPSPSFELRETVRRYLEARCESNLAARHHVFVDSPDYARVDVSVTVVATSIDVASQVEGTVLEELKVFLHPLTGGPHGDGWEFGRDVSASDVYALLEEIEGVDHVEKLVFTVNNEVSSERVRVKPNQLISSGKHTIDISIANGG